MINEINYIKKLNTYLDKRLLFENENNNFINIENLDEILDLKDNTLKNNEYKDSNFNSLKIDDNQKIGNLNLNNENKLNIQNINGNKEYKSDINLNKINTHSFLLNSECADFQCENNQNFFNFEIPKINKFNFNLEKSSLICDLSNVDINNNFIYEN